VSPCFPTSAKARFKVSFTIYATHNNINFVHILLTNAGVVFLISEASVKQKPPAKKRISP
jgi:hypothetical protein